MMNEKKKEPRNTKVILVHDSDSQHHTLIKREMLSDEYVFEKTIISESWPDGVLDVYIREKEDDIINV
jgi:hypothetical protein